MSDKELLLFSLLGLIAFLLFVVLFLMLKLRYKNSDNSLKFLQNELFNLNKTFDEKLYYTNKILSENLSKNSILTARISDNSNKMIQELIKKISSIEQTNKEIKDIGKELKGIENILQNPKQRGILGEYFLETILKNILAPENYQVQYKFKNGIIADAVIFLDKKILAIDSKFSLENYNKFINAETKQEQIFFQKEFIKDIKKRIDETGKYIDTSENTMDFAFMFIPSEMLYYDLLVNKVGNIANINLIEYAFKQKNVIIVSPTSFYAYLQTVMQGLKAFKIETQISDIKKHISNLQRHLSTYEKYFYKIGTTLTTTINHYDIALKEFKKIDKDILKIEKDD